MAWLFAATSNEVVRMDFAIGSGQISFLVRFSPRGHRVMC